MADHLIQGKNTNRSQLAASIIAIAALLVVTLTPGIVSAQTVTGPDGCGSLVPTLKGWVVPAPRYPDGGRYTVTYAVDPWSPKTLLATNGSVVLKSTDSGCSWREVFSLSKDAPERPLPVGGSDGKIAAIVTAGQPRASYYLMVNDGFDTESLGQPHIYRSRDAGLSWQLADDGLPIESAASHLVFAPGDPNIGYMVVRRGTIGGISFYYTRDGGDSWESATELADTLPTSGEIEDSTSASAAVLDLAVSPMDPQELWAATNLGVLRSGDGGRTWAKVTNFPGEGSPDNLGKIHISPDGSAEIIRIFSTSSSDTTNYVSRDAGKSWRAYFAPGPLDSIVEGTGGPDELIGAFNAAGTRVFISEGNRWVVLTDFGGSSYSNLQRDFTAQPRFYLSTGSSLWIYQPTDIELARNQRVPARLEGICRHATKELSSPSIVSQAPGLSPTTTTVTLSPGKKKEVHYQLSLPPRPTLDTYFLVDTTGSMGGAICGVRAGLQEIVQALVDERVDVQLGLGEFKDYSVGFGDTGDYPYRRLREISPPSEQLSNALAGLSATGGGDSPEADLPALFQAATGAGQKVADPVPSSGDIIPSGQQAGFRDDALKVILIVSDADWHEPPGYPGPSWTETVDALNARGIKVVGVSIGTGSEDDMRRMATDTSTFATEDVDCNDDGFTDLMPGDPLVCTLQSGTEIELMGPAITDLLKSLEDRRSVSLVEDGRSGWIDSVMPGVYPGINVEDRNVLDFKVTYRCSEDKVGSISGVNLSAEVSGAPVTGATAIVSCSLPNRHEPRQIPGLAVGPPPLPPPARIPQPQPQPQPQPGSQQQAQQQAQQQGNAQAAAVAQRQEQPQFAFVHAAQQLKEQVSGQHAMQRVVRQEHDPLAAAKFGLAMSSISMLLVYGLATATVRRRFARIDHR